MTVIINQLDLTPYIKLEGLEIYRKTKSKKLETLDGYTHVYKSGEKVSFKADLIPLTFEQLHTVFNVIKETQSEVTATITDPYSGINYTFTGVCERKSAKLLVKYRNGTEYFDGVSLAVEEC